MELKYLVQWRSDCKFSKRGLKIQDEVCDASTKLSQTTIFNAKCEHTHWLDINFAVHESIIHTKKIWEILAKEYVC